MSVERGAERSDVVAGGRDQLEAFLRHAGPLLRRALVARNGVELGDDAAAEATAYAVEHWERLKHMENPKGYLYRVGQSSVRRQRRHGSSTTLVDLPSIESGPIDLDLRRALMRLNRDQRVAVFLAVACSYSHQDVAQILDRSTVNVGNLVRRGLRRMRRDLEERQ